MSEATFTLSKFTRESHSFKQEVHGVKNGNDSAQRNTVVQIFS